MLVIYDWDNTLIDSEHAIAKIDAQLMREMFNLSITGQDVFTKLQGQSSRNKLLSVARWNKREHEIMPAYDQFRAARQQELKTIYTRDDVQLFPFTAAVLQEFHDEGLHMCIGSNAQSADIAKGVAHHGLSHIFGENAIYGKDRANNVAKPAPDLFLNIAKDFGYARKHCVVIGDSTADMKAAKAAGMTALGFIKKYEETEEGVTAQQKLWDAGANYIMYGHQNADRFMAHLKRNEAKGSHLRLIK
jgi:beta-phosphoglucomutase-like phosphatase (HAD superfamily)